MPFCKRRGVTRNILYYLQVLFDDPKQVTTVEILKFRRYQRSAFTTQARFSESILWESEEIHHIRDDSRILLGFVMHTLNQRLGYCTKGICLVFARSRG